MITHALIRPLCRPLAVSLAVPISRGFRPSTLPGIWAWYDALDASTLYDATSGGSLVALGSPVARVNDKSGNGRHLTQTDPTKRPLRSALGVASDNVNDRLEIARTRTGAYTLCVRMKLTNIGGYSRFFGINYTYSGVFADNTLAMVNEDVAWGSSAVTPTLNSMATVTLVRSSATYVELRVNGSAIATLNGGQAGDADAFLALMKGEYSRVVLTESVLSGTQLTALETWVAATI